MRRREEKCATEDLGGGTAMNHFIAGEGESCPCAVLVVDDLTFVTPEVAVSTTRTRSIKCT